MCGLVKIPSLLSFFFLFFYGYSLPSLPPQWYKESWKCSLETEGKKIKILFLKWSQGFLYFLISLQFLSLLAELLLCSHSS